MSEQWFVRTETLAAPGAPLREQRPYVNALTLLAALSAMERGDLRIVPPRFERVYSNWLTGIQDWCVSRQLWWGHRIPVWYVHNSAAAAEAAVARDGKGAHERFVVAHDEAEALRLARDLHGGGVVLTQETDVLDTWFSSSLWPFSALGWPEETAALRDFYPTTVMETGHDILFFWVARMVMMGVALTGKVPFRRAHTSMSIRSRL